MANDLVRQLLAERGDDGASLRHVVHYAYPDKSARHAARSAVQKGLEHLGFKVTNAAQDGGVIFDHHVPVAEDKFDKLTTQLESWFQELGWEYDGWEAAVDPAQRAK